jgi:hypothetical protein
VQCGLMKEAALCHPEQHCSCLFRSLSKQAVCAAPLDKRNIPLRLPNCALTVGCCCTGVGGLHESLRACTKR